MFEDVVQMEKEIETFRKNIVASSELVEGIAQLTETTKKQTSSFSASADELIKRIDQSAKQTKENNDATLQELNKSNSVLIATLQRKMSDEQTTRLAEMEQIKTALEQLQQEYAARLKRTDSIVEKYQAELGVSTKRIQEEYEAILNTLTERINSSIASMQEKGEENLQDKIAEIDRIKKSIEEYRDHTVCVVEKYQEELGASTKRIQEEYEASLNTLTERINTSIASMQERGKADLQDRVAEIDKIKNAIKDYQVQADRKADEQINLLVNECERLISEMKNELSTQQIEFIEKTSQAEQAIHGYQAEMEKEYEDFIQKIESTNIDQIYSEVQSLKRSVRTKFIVIMTGIGVSLIVSVLSLLRK